MKTFYLCIFLFTVSFTGGFCEEAADEGKIPTYYLTSYSGFTVKTSHPDITVWTKTNPFTAKDDELIQGEIIFSPKISVNEEWSVFIDIYEPKLEKVYQNKIGDVWANVTEYTYKDTNQKTKSISVCLRVKYFANAVVRFSYGNNLDGGELHLCKLKQIKAEPAGAAQPATQPADKVPAKVQPSPPTSKDGPR